MFCRLCDDSNPFCLHSWYRKVARNRLNLRFSVEISYDKRDIFVYCGGIYKVSRMNLLRFYVNVCVCVEHQLKFIRNKLRQDQMQLIIILHCCIAKPHLKGKPASFTKFHTIKLMTANLCVKIVLPPEK